MSDCEMHIYVLEGKNVGIETPDGFITLTARVAVEMAQSLTLAAIEADPDMDAEQVVEEYVSNRLKGAH